MKHKKPKSSTKKNKKNKNINNNAKKTKTTPSVEELVNAGDAAMASMEYNKALAMFKSANTLLLEQQKVNEKNNNNNNNNNSTSTNNNNISTIIYEKQRVTVLEKLGDVQATMGDLNTAKQTFNTAIQLWMSYMKVSSTNNDNINIAEYQEILAGLYLYIGQLSSELEALEAYKKGLLCLEQSVTLREKQIQEEKQQQQQSSLQSTEEDMEIMETDEVTTKNDNNNNNSNETEEATPQAMLQEARRKLVSARVTVAELYLTDLCYEENAELECESYVSLALKIQDDNSSNDSDNKESCMVDALQTAANLRLSQQRNQEARQYILRAYNKIETGCEALAKLVGLDEEKKKSKRSVELIEVDAADNLPSLEFRCQTAKLLLECAAATSSTSSSSTKDDDAQDAPKLPAAANNVTKAVPNQPPTSEEEQEQIKCFKAAVHVLGSVLAENDELPEIWYLLGCAYKGLNNAELAIHYWTHALEMLTKIHEDLEKEMEETATTDMQDDDDDDDAHDELEMELQSIACQIEEIRSKLEDEGDNSDMEEE